MEMDNLWKSNLLNLKPYLVGFIYFSQLSGIDGASYCYIPTYYTTCEHGCCGTGCCYNKVSLALGLIFGLLGLILLSSGFAICFVQYWFKRKKTITTRDASTQYESAPSGNPMKPSSIPQNLMNDFKQKKKAADVKKAEEAKKIEEAKKANGAKKSDEVSVPLEEN